MSFREDVLRGMEERGFGIDELVEKMIQVARGEKIKTVYNSAGLVITKTVSSDPKDVARGLMLVDALRGGDLGLTPQEVKVPNPADRVYAAYAPATDARINARNNLTLVAPLLSGPSVSRAMDRAAGPLDPEEEF